jgi:GMP synthase-like glutamine amidotransferase
VYDEGAPDLTDQVLAAKVPVLGICYGLHTLAHSLAGLDSVRRGESGGEYGSATLERDADAGDSPLFDLRGARAAGLAEFVLVDPVDAHPGYQPRVASLDQLPALLD